MLPIVPPPDTGQSIKTYPSPPRERLIALADGSNAFVPIPLVHFLFRRFECLLQPVQHSFGRFLCNLCLDQFDPGGAFGLVVSPRGRRDKRELNGNNTQRMFTHD
jgi:hypothetical protein